ncbi:HlyD family secretion protein [Erwinia sp. AnSW2-5]|uniref:HlyD family secretion protein n=1 Tax=Erwinia sp. AnSW2-5 TaxID=3367692 RepID=UPI00385A234D
MSESLFRKEALESNKTKMIGSVALYCPPYRWLVIGVVAFITTSLVIFFVFGSYTKRETAVGDLLPVGGIMTVSPPVSGTVVKLSVSEGQSVRKGQPLIEISSEVATSLGRTRHMVADQLELQRTRLQADLVALVTLNKEAMQGLKERLTLLQSQLKQTEIQRKQRIRQIELARVQLNKIQQMHKEGYASNTQVEQQETTLLDTDSRLQETTRQQLDLQQQIAQTSQQLREQPLNALNQQHDMQSKLSDIDQQVAENESRRSVVLQAPQDSVVGAILTKQGQIVSPGQSVVSLLPENGKLQARMMVSSRSIGFIQKGQRVVLRYQAYPYQKFGQQYGYVTEVSRTALSPQEVATLTGNNDVREQHYRVIVDLDKQDILVYGKKEHLKPGIALEADFLIDNRRLIEWVLEPLYALGRRSAS